MDFFLIFFYEITFRIRRPPVLSELDVQLQISVLLQNGAIQVKLILKQILIFQAICTLEKNLYRFLIHPLVHQ